MRVTIRDLCIFNHCKICDDVTIVTIFFLYCGETTVNDREKEQILNLIDSFFDSGRQIAKALATSWLTSCDAQNETGSQIVTTPAQQVERLMTVEEVADYLRVKEQTIYTWAKDGSIPCERPKGELRFRRAAIDEWMTPNGEKIEPAREKSNGVVKSPRSFLRPTEGSKGNGRL